MTDVTCLILTYNPNIEDLKNTIMSCVLQENVLAEIIISDDGSQIDYSKNIKKTFEKYNFKKYKIVLSNKNNGTVHNLFQGLKHCNGKWVKLLAPGDFFPDNYCLEKWVLFLKDKGYRWAFSPAYYYQRKENEESNYIAYPQRGDICSDGGKRSIYYYLVCNNVGIGATYICERKLLLEYIPVILHRVKYAEDMVFKLLMYNGIVGGYIDEKMLSYAVDSGISTAKNYLWEQKLSEDYKNLAKIIITTKAKKKYQLYIKSLIWTDLLSNRRLAAIVKMVLSPRFFVYFYNLKFHRKKEKVYSFSLCPKNF